jgi:hypothetical protein
MHNSFSVRIAFGMLKDSFRWILEIVQDDLARKREGDNPVDLLPIQKLCIYTLKYISSALGPPAKAALHFTKKGAVSARVMVRQNTFLQNNESNRSSLAT